MAQSKSLPARPNLEHLKKQAKQRLQSMRQRNAAVKLSAAQLQIAREYGFDSWRKLQAHVIQLSAAPAALVEEFVKALTSHNAETVGGMLRQNPVLARASRSDGATMLHLAAELNEPELVRRLLQAGANPEAKFGQYGHTPLSWATTCRAFDAAKALIESGSEPDLFCAAGLGDLIRVRRFFDRDGKLIAGASKTGSSRYAPDGKVLPCPPTDPREIVADALYIACRQGQVATARELLSHEPDLSFRGYLGGTPLHWAYFSTSIEIVQMLLAAGADSALRDHEFRCAPRTFGICVAANWGIAPLVGAWLKYDPKLANTNEGRRPPLHHAARGGHSDIVQLLLDAGADRNARDTEGKTALELAIENGHPELAPLLESSQTRQPKVHSDAVLAELSNIFKTFAKEECAGRSSLYEHLSNAIADDAELLSLASHGRAPIPNLFFAAVHYLLLRNPNAALARFYPSIELAPLPGKDAADEFKQFCLAHRAQVIAIMQTRRVQTNEAARSGYLLPAFAIAAEMVDHKPLALIEIGASAGLNLCFDHYAFEYGAKFGVRGDRKSGLKLVVELRGEIAPPIPDKPPKIAQRIGIDLQPLSASDPEGAAWLEALVWPEHRERREQLHLALTIAAKVPIRMIAGDASNVIADVVRSIPEDQVPCIFQTHALNQFSHESRLRLTKELHELGKKREVIFISRDRRLTMDHSHGGETDVMLLADCDAHGKWIEWKRQPLPPPNVEEIAKRAIQKMERGWAESQAIVERHFDDRGEAPYWEPLDVKSPTLRESEADEAIIQSDQEGLYRMISVWRIVNVTNRRWILGVPIPTRSLEIFKTDDPTAAPEGGLWRRVAVPTIGSKSRLKRGQWEDLAAALRYLHEKAPDGIYRVVTVRRMLRAQRVKGRMKIVKKHASAAQPNLSVIIDDDVEKIRGEIAKDDRDGA